MSPVTPAAADEQWVELLGEHNRIVRDCLASNNGREVRTEGDGFMLAFGSARDALHCAIAMQLAFAERNEGLAEDGMLCGAINGSASRLTWSRG